MMAKKYFFLVPALFLLLQSACQKAPPKTSQEIQAQTPTESELAALEKKYDYQSVGAFGQVRISGGGKTRSFDAALLVQDPGLVHIEIINDLGQVLTRIISDGHQLLYFETKENAYALLPNDEASFKRALKLPISPGEFASRLLLNIPPPETRDSFSIGVDPTKLQLLSIARRKAAGSQKEIDRITYQNYSGGTDDYPRFITWSFKKPKVEIQFRIHELSLQGPQPMTKFDTRPPPGASRGEIR